ncbi:MAG: hypothetical protein H6728_17970 [Myxococcales bacterium]|nr:hypothetical protein [Myxococcales bacterium]
MTTFGFETLNAELKVMLGDEAYTQSLVQRYDANRSQLRAFLGDKIEPNGVALSGVLGAEMAQLYTAVHYYQMVLDRFYQQVGVFSSSFQASDTAFLQPSSVTSYFQKILLAASRKARTWSAIAQRYHQINRLDLATLVLERSIISTYIEMMVMTRILRQFLLSLDRSQIDGLRLEIDRITRTFSAALLAMQNTYRQVSQQLNPFGFSSDYIPFPALDRFSSSTLASNAFEVGLEYTKQLLVTAQEKEVLALQSNQLYEAQAANFQSELAKIESNFNSQLIRICGGITKDGRLVPLIAENLSPQDLIKSKGEPCGRLAGSAIYEAYLRLQQVAIEARKLPAMQQLLQEKITREEERIRAYCQNNFQLSQVTWQYQQTQRNLTQATSESQFLIQRATQAAMGLMGIAASWQCEVLLGTALGGSCANAAVSRALQITILAAKETAVTVLSLEQRRAQAEMTDMTQQFARSQIKIACDLCPPNQPNCPQAGAARIASQNYLSQLALQMVSLRLESLRVEIDMRLAVAEIERLRSQAQRIARERQESTEMLTQVQASFYDPNARIYKNDAVLSAEQTFQDAIREAYRSTLLYEYHTGTSYAAKGDLFLIRLVSSGDKSLETYVSQLEQAYRDFEEKNSKPDIRIAVISLRDDILKLAQTSGTSVLSLTERIAAFQKYLADPSHRNEAGYLVFPFELSVHAQSSVVSPITFNHKVLYIESEIVGNDVGDAIGRLYLQQNGTSVMRELDGNYKFYKLPQRTAVLNPFFNGARVFTPEIYQNFRLQDRPLGNTRWELQFNQASEKTNQDINLLRLEDIRLYLYYTDLTKN